MAIDELGKSQYENCVHLAEYGCGQYEARPDVCRRFECMYLSDGWGKRPGGEVMRPDSCGLLVHGIRDQNGQPAIRVAEVKQHAMEGEIAQALLAGLLEEGYLVEIHRRDSEPYRLGVRNSA